MEAYFDNKGNILNAALRTPHDSSAVYTLKTTFGLRGRKLTVLRDENPAPGVQAKDAGKASVGSIFWKEKMVEVMGVRRGVKEVRRREGGFFRKTHYWRWEEGRREYEVKHDHAGWKAILDNNMSIAARFLVPSRPHLFSKADPPSVHLTKTALEADEVFLILVFVYEELKRQDRTVRDFWLLVR
ncbi:hypothetical protein FPV67DRAFT_1552661 [Lyophyllum atratum]|nr:hypothetical protein FPV67DRAFT_1552661 [Lyophyllum atratum]